MRLFALSARIACLRRSISMRRDVDGEEVVVEDFSHVMKTRAFAPLNLRATRQPQALNRHARRASCFVTCHRDVVDFFKKGGIWGFTKCSVWGEFCRL